MINSKDMEFYFPPTKPYIMDNSILAGKTDMENKNGPMGVSMRDTTLKMKCAD